MMYGHFWYSEKQRHVRDLCKANFAMINGKRMEYTEMNGKRKKAGGLWDDYQYLGYGYFLEIIKDC